MYYKNLETVEGAKALSDRTHRAASADRMKKVGIKAAGIRRKKESAKRMHATINP